jgi:hypothetical protein
MKTTITGIVYLDMIQHFISPLNEDDQERRIHFQQDGAPPHYLRELCGYLNTRLPAAPKAWPPRSPDFTALDFFFWGFVTDRVFACKYR